MWIWPLGLVSWILAGAAVGALGARLLPGRPPLRLGAALATAVAAAVFGGLIATYLGFGGLAAFDPRSLAVAGLTALVAVASLRLASLEPPGSPS